MASPGRNKYEVLGVAEDADQREIRSAYRKMAMMHHPDKGGDKETFQEIQSAYEILGDEDARRRYDHQLRNPQGFSGFPGSNGGFPDFGGFNFSDLFGGSSGGGGFNFDFGGGGFGEDEDQFEDFLKSAFFGGGGTSNGFNFTNFPGGGGFPAGGGFPGGGGGGKSEATPSWFFDFDMDDEEYFRRQEEEQQDRRQKMEKFVEEQKEKRRIAKEQWHAEKLKREKERPQNNHRKILRKNVLKLIDKEVPEIREDLEDKLELISASDMEALWLVLSDRGSRSVVDCLVDAMEDFGHPIAAPKKKSAKKKKGKAADDQKEVPEPARAPEVKAKSKCQPDGKAKAAPKTKTQSQLVNLPQPAEPESMPSGRVESKAASAYTVRDALQSAMGPNTAESGCKSSANDHQEARVQPNPENAQELQRPRDFLDQLWAFLLWILSFFAKHKPC